MTIICDLFKYKQITKAFKVISFSMYRYMLI